MLQSVLDETLPALEENPGIVGVRNGCLVKTSRDETEGFPALHLLHELVLLGRINSAQELHEK